MMYTQENETAILENWHAIAERNGDTNFTYDGLLFRGSAKQDEDGHWFYPRGQEESLWNRGKGVLFLTKDPNSKAGDDIRTWTGRKPKCHEVVIPSLFFRNLTRWVYGFESILTGRDEYGSFNQISDGMAAKSFDRYPVARINIKKEAGKGTIKDTDLVSYLMKDGYYQLLQAEIQLFEAASIIYCGVGNAVFEIIRTMLNAQCIDGNKNLLYTSKLGSREILVINGYHPAYPGRGSNVVSSDDFYRDMMEAVSAYFKRVK